MKLLDNLNNMATLPKTGKILIVWYEEGFDHPRHFIKEVKRSLNGNLYYTSDNDAIFNVPVRKAIGWCYL